MRGSTWLKVVLGLLVLAFALAVGGRPVWIGVRTAAIIAEGFPGSPWRPLASLTPPPAVSEVSFPVGDSLVRADLYQPQGTGPHPAIVAAHGVGVPLGKQDPRLVRLAETLARAGYVVLMPQLDAMVEMRLVRQDVEALVAAVEYLLEHPAVDSQRIAVAGFCVSAAYSLLAAQDPRISERVSLVVSWGSYHSLVNMLRAVTTESYFCRGELRSFEREPHVEHVLVRKVLEMQSRPEDTALLQQIFPQYRLVDAGQPNLVARLSPEGRASYELLTNRDPRRVVELVSHLSAVLQAELTGLSPDHSLDRLRAQVLIVHGVADPTTPYCESETLYNALKERDRVQLHLFQIFHHVNPVFPPIDVDTMLGLYIPEMARFYAFLYQLQLLL